MVRCSICAWFREFIFSAPWSYTGRLSNRCRSYDRYEMCCLSAPLQGTLECTACNGRRNFFPFAEPMRIGKHAISFSCIRFAFSGRILSPACFYVFGQSSVLTCKAAVVFARLLSSAEPTLPCLPPEPDSVPSAPAIVPHLLPPRPSDGAYQR